MANTYYQLYVQIVFAVKNRSCLIHEPIREEIQKYICGIIKRDKCKPISIYCNPDHTHIFVGIRPSISLSDLVKDIKSVSSKFINEKKIIPVHFNWQDGYGAFSYSHSHIKNVDRYIRNQPKHHKKQNFKDEYLNFLDKFEIDHDNKYLFDFL